MKSFDINKIHYIVENTKKNQNKNVRTHTTLLLNKNTILLWYTAVCVMGYRRGKISRRNWRRDGLEKTRPQKNPRPTFRLSRWRLADTSGDGRLDRHILVRDTLYTALSPHILLFWNQMKTTVCLISRCINPRAYYILLSSMEVFLIKFHEHVHGRHSTKREFTTILLHYTQRKHNIIFYFFYLSTRLLN